MDTTLTANSKEALMLALGDRYGRKKSILYNWLNICGVSAVKENGNYFFKPEDLAQLDRLNDWCNEGNKAVDFPERVNGGALTKMESGSIEETAIPLETNNPLPDEFAQLIRLGQEKGAGLLIAQNLLAQQFAANPELLTPDLLQQVKESERAIAPKSQDPKQYAKRFMQMAQNTAAA